MQQIALGFIAFPENDLQAILPALVFRLIPVVAIQQQECLEVFAD